MSCHLLALNVPLRYRVITKGAEIERHKVVLFLHLTQMAADYRFIFMDRAKNLATLALMGISRQDAQDRVMALKPDDYVSGPSPDHNFPGQEVGVFGFRVNKQEVYVKLRVFADPPERCVCISFHVSDRPMHYPFREATPPVNEKESR